MVSKKEMNCFNLFYTSLGLTLSKKQENESLPKTSSVGRILPLRLFPFSQESDPNYQARGKDGNIPITVVVLDSK